MRAYAHVRQVKELMRDEWGYSFSISFPLNPPDLADVDRDVTELTLDFKTKNWELLPEFQSLRRLCISAKGDAMLEAAAALPKLEEVQLYLTKGNLRLPRGIKKLNIETSEIGDMTVFEQFRELTHLGIRRVKRLDDVGQLGALTSLRVLELGIVIWERPKLGGLDFLAGLINLEELLLYFDKFDAESLSPLYSLPKLRQLLIGNKLPMEAFAEASVRMPNVDCMWFSPFIEYTDCPKCGTGRMVMFAGKGRGTACTACAPEKISKRTAEWDAAVAAAQRKQTG